MINTISDMELSFGNWNSKSSF